MTREEIKEMLPIMQAFAEGKVIQFRKGYDWIDIKTGEDLSFLRSPSDYRIKPEPRYRPFETQKECWEEMQKHQPFGWIKNNVDNVFNILAMFNNTVKLNDYYNSYSELFKECKFIDNSPFGIKVE